MEDKKRPGFVLYHADVHNLESLDGESFKTLILALSAFSEGIDYEKPTGATGALFEFMKQKKRRSKEDRYGNRKTVLLD